MRHGTLPGRARLAGNHHTGKRAPKQLLQARQAGPTREEERGSEDEFEAELGGEGDAEGGAEAEEIAESAGGCAQLTEAGNGARLDAGEIEAEGSGVRKIVDRRGKSRNVRNEVVAGIPAVEEIEKFGERAQREALAKNDVAADAKIDLIERSAAELVEGGLHAVDDGAIVGDAVAIDVRRRGKGEGAGAFELRDGGGFEFPRELQNTDEDETMANVFAGGAVVAGAKRIVDVRNAVNVIEELADGGAPGGGMSENVVGGELETLREAMLHLESKAIEDGAIIGTEQGKGGKLVAAVLVNALLMLIGDAEAPIAAERVFVGGAGRERIGRVIPGVDQGGGAGAVLDIEVVDGGEGVDPAVLREIVVVQAEAGAKNGS